MQVLRPPYANTTRERGSALPSTCRVRVNYARSIIDRESRELDDSDLARELFKCLLHVEKQVICQKCRILNNMWQFFSAFLPLLLVGFINEISTREILNIYFHKVSAIE